MQPRQKKYNSLKIKPAGVAESPIVIECLLYKIIELGGKAASGNLILGEICMFHINDNLLTNKNKLKTRLNNIINKFVIM